MSQYTKPPPLLFLRRGRRRGMGRGGGRRGRILIERIYAHIERIELNKCFNVLIENGPLKYVMALRFCKKSGPLKVVM